MENHLSSRLKVGNLVLLRETILEGDCQSTLQFNLSYPNKDQYQGEYADGIRQGKGKYIFNNGDRYEGDFRNNKKHGIGKITYLNKGEYYGTLILI